MRTLVNTTLCYIQKDNKYLMLHRTKKQNDYNHDKWIGIGGKFENGESPHDCAIREIQEETGLQVKLADLEYCGIVTFVDLTEKNDEGKSLSPGPSPEPVLDAPHSNGGQTPVTPPEKNSYTEFMHIFRTKNFSGNLKEDCNEGDLEWVEIKKMNDLPHWKGDEIFLDLLEKNAPFFSLKLTYKDGILLESVLY